MNGTLESRLAAVRERLERACRAAGRDPARIRLLPVTKSVAPEIALELAALGFEEFGENRLDGLAAKARAFRERGLPARWHFVGQIQRNKLRRILADAQVLHSVDRPQLLASLASTAAELGLRPAVYLQVRYDDDPRRAGFEPAAVPDAVAACRSLAAFDLRGLMTLAPRPVGDEERDRDATRRAFSELAALARGLARDPALGAAFVDGRCELSMGMSADLELAVAAGADLVRVGTALVGPTASEDARETGDGPRQDAEPPAERPSSTPSERGSA